MSNSGLVSYTRLSPNHSGVRNHRIDRISPHCVVGQCSVATLGAVFAPRSRGASANYGIGFDGRVGMYVEEKNRSWCTSSSANDNRAVTIECASDTYHPYAMNSKVYESLINLCVDICRRNGKKKLLWLDRSGISYRPKSDEMVITVHRWFANKSCPGDWLYSRLGNLAKEVTAKLGGKYTVPTPKPATVNDDIIVDSWWGPATTRKAQKAMGTYQDGIVSNQLMNSNCKPYMLRSAGGWDWDWSTEGGSALIKALQRKVGASADGYLGRHTVIAMQKYLNSQGEKLDVDGYFGDKTGRAFQRWLNKIA